MCAALRFFVESPHKGGNYTNKPQADINRESKFDLFHELGHQIGIHDHYCYNEDSDSKEVCANEHCRKCNGLSEIDDAMLTRKDIEDTGIELYCSICRNLALTHLENHH